MAEERTKGDVLRQMIQQYYNVMNIYLLDVPSITGQRYTGDPFRTAPSSLWTEHTWKNVELLLLLTEPL